MKVSVINNLFFLSERVLAQQLKNAYVYLRLTMVRLFQEIYFILLKNY